jgi:hypothetical protein
VAAVPTAAPASITTAAPSLSSGRPIPASASSLATTASPAALIPTRAAGSAARRVAEHLLVLGLALVHVLPLRLGGLHRLVPPRRDLLPDLLLVALEAPHELVQVALLVGRTDLPQLLKQ